MLPHLKKDQIVFQTGLPIIDPSLMIGYDVHTI